MQDPILLSSPGPSHLQPIRQAPLFALAPNQKSSLQHHLLEKHLFTTNFSSDNGLPKHNVSTESKVALFPVDFDENKPNRQNEQKPAIEFEDISENISKSG